ncbi:hypothetical protein KCH_73090 [Kitasatospora cheerisanensis KCTC 2395]|uniref:Uncharacterized protein n=1 Tax=Kitasatospora cheerisanensis KCTC 2395 TaxID=1348663 RepID=A0A066YS88_9ACTN|nr:hypothetical protein KCH_73090 [Kitasatospora cheerisanensis KCTC 2395]
MPELGGGAVGGVPARHPDGAAAGVLTGRQRTVRALTWS